VTGAPPSSLARNGLELRPHASNAAAMRECRNPLRIIESSLCGSMCGSQARRFCR
jgi:hypothetical protein